MYICRILGLYSSIILLISQLIRGFIVETQSKIMFEELPNVDRIWKLLLSIIYAREANDFIIEITLYEKLVYLHRDPQLLIRITRDFNDEKLSSTRVHNSPVSDAKKLN